MYNEIKCFTQYNNMMKWYIRTIYQSQTYEYNTYALSKCILYRPIYMIYIKWFTNNPLFVLVYVHTHTD